MDILTKTMQVQENMVDVRDSIRALGQPGISISEMIERLDVLRESVIDYPREDLESTVWDKTGDSYTIKEPVRQKIVHTLSQYDRMDLDKVAKRIHITGSIGTNQYDDDTDIDVHLIVDQKDFDDPGGIQRDAFKYFRDLDQKVGLHPIEVYLQFNEAQEMLSDAVYDLRRDTWIKGPRVVDENYDPYEDYADVMVDVADAAFDADKLLGELRRDVIDHRAIETAMGHMTSGERSRLMEKLKTKLGEIEDDIEQLMALRGQWVDMRRKSSAAEPGKSAIEDIEVVKKWNDANAIFKFLNRYRYMKTISALEKLSANGIDKAEVDDVGKAVGGMFGS
jgi:hypothetical protein